MLCGEAEKYQYDSPVSGGLTWSITLLKLFVALESKQMFGFFLDILIFSNLLISLYDI
jgi:hypothetical protein